MDHAHDSRQEKFWDWAPGSLTSKALYISLCLSVLSPSRTPWQMQKCNDNTQVVTENSHRETTVVLITKLAAEEGSQKYSFVFLAYLILPRPRCFFPWYSLSWSVCLSTSPGSDVKISSPGAYLQDGTEGPRIEILVSFCLRGRMGTRGDAGAQHKELFWVTLVKAHVVSDRLA